MTPVSITHIVGARPNFMKVAPVLRALEHVGGFRNRLVHTGQHYDRELSSLLFEELELPDPDENLGVGSGSHASQTASLLKKIESDFLASGPPDLVLVVGDVNSTLAAALVASKLRIPIAHVEAGLRSGDRRMPEEVNRVITDQLADLLFTHSPEAVDHLLREGIERTRIHEVGNVMIDTLEALRPRAERLGAAQNRGLVAGEYVLATVHRPSNVDVNEIFSEILDGLEQIHETLPVLLPLHPRARTRLEALERPSPCFQVIEPVGYVEMLSLQSTAAVVVTDSGGLQEETTVLGVPCITIRDSTERPVTISEGTNRLVPERTAANIVAAVNDALQRRPEEPRRPRGWDGRAAERIADVLVRWARRR